VKLIGTDIGGTFTDLVLADSEQGQIWIHKVPTTADPSHGMIEGIRELCQLARVAPEDLDHVLHGTTIATNALLTYEGTRAGMITTQGYRDILHLGRHQRPLNYSLKQEVPWQHRPLVERRYRKTVSERVGPKGEVLTPLDEAGARRAIQELREAGVDSIAVCLLFSYVNQAHENRVAELVREVYPDAFVTTSASIFPQFREFERFTTACINAFVGPKVKRYVTNLTTRMREAGVRSEPHMMRSNGGVSTAAMASEKPVMLLLSGPAAGVLGGHWVGQLSGRSNLITFDMGGTSADIGLVTARGIVEASARDTWVAGYPVMVPMIDVHTIGAGGGSIAYVDPGGAFRVGPKSAGADPGPACYGKGGREPTVTDANVVLNRLDKEYFLGGDMAIMSERSFEVVQRLADQLGVSLYDAAEGILTIVNHNMANAIRSRTIQKGHDPRGFALVAFGGAGPLHAADVARSLGIPEVIVPLFPGITSAMGLLTTDLKYDLIRNLFMLSTALDIGRVNRELAALVSEVRTQLRADGVSESDIRIAQGADCRYLGQGFELRIAFPDDQLDDKALAHALEGFHGIHQAEYGHSFPGSPIEVVNLRVVGIGAMPKLSPPKIGAGTTLDDARVKRADTYFRRDGALRPYGTDFFLRDRLPVGQLICGPAVILQKDSTTVVPPGSEAMLADSGNLILRAG
jgi:N-methylhydantoinase A